MSNDDQIKKALLEDLATEIVEEVCVKLDKAHMGFSYDYGIIRRFVFDYIDKGMTDSQEIMENLLMDHIVEEFCGNA